MNYTLEIEIDQPREKVVELFNSQENLPFWQPGFISAEPISGEPGAEGSKTRLLYDNRGREVEMIETVTVIDLPEEFSATFDAKGMHMEVRCFFEEAGPGKTLYRTENTAIVSGLFMKLMVLIMPGCFRKESFKYMENLKAFVETGADVREKG